MIREVAVEFLEASGEEVDVVESLFVEDLGWVEALLLLGVVDNDQMVLFIFLTNFKANSKKTGKMEKLKNW